MQDTKILFFCIETKRKRLLFLLHPRQFSTRISDTMMMMMMMIRATSKTIRERRRHVLHSDFTTWKRIHTSSLQRSGGKEIDFMLSDWKQIAPADAKQKTKKNKNEGRGRTQENFVTRPSLSQTKTRIKKKSGDMISQTFTSIFFFFGFNVKSRSGR